MSRSSRKAVTTAIVAHGDSEIARLRERVRVLDGALQFIANETRGTIDYLKGEPVGVNGRIAHAARTALDPSISLAATNENGGAL